MKKYYSIILILTIVLCGTIANDLYAQCPMCKMAAESNLKSGGAAGKGLNTGILYLLSMPYIVVLTLALLWKKNRKKLAQ